MTKRYDIGSDDRWLRRSFWSTVTWPKHEAIFILVAVPIGFFLIGSLYGGPLDGLILATVMLAVVLVLWPIARVLKAWAEWPSQFPGLNWLKAVVRYLLTDR